LCAWRSLGLETRDASVNMAIDEAVFRTRIKGSVPNTLRFYCWNPSAVSVGRFQSVEKEVQLENCRKQGVDVVRRITGGGTVYHGAGDEITYSLIAGKDGLKAKDIADVYAKVYAGLAEAIGTFGLTADFNEGTATACPNLTVKGRKISGSAQCHRAGVVLQHGTLLVRINLEKMFTLLRVPWANSRMQVVRVARERITSLEDELARSVSMRTVYDALIEGFQGALSVSLVDEELTQSELELAEDLRRRKYATCEWNFRANCGV
jgi:lipoate-protein ligase A